VIYYMIAAIMEWLNKSVCERVKNQSNVCKGVHMFSRVNVWFVIYLVYQTIIF
jgi:hypothetical protein